MFKDRTAMTRWSGATKMCVNLGEIEIEIEIG